MKQLKIQIVLVIAIVSLLLLANLLYNYLIYQRAETIYENRDLINKTSHYLHEIINLSIKIDNDKHEFLLSKNDSVKDKIIRLENQVCQMLDTLNIKLISNNLQNTSIEQSVNELQRLKSDFPLTRNNFDNWINNSKSEILIINNAINNIDNVLFNHKANMRAQSEVFMSKIYYSDIVLTLIIIGFVVIASFLLTNNKKVNTINAELKSLNSTKDKFVSIISHDLKSPFNAILGFSNLLVDNMDKYPTEKSKKFIINIQQVAQKTYELLENLLEWSRLQTGKLKANLQPINLNATINEVLLLLNNSANQKDIQLSYDISTNFTIFADKEMIKTILRNLITNSIKFTETCGKIEIKVSDYQNLVSISVTDTGVGIEKKDLNELFKLETEKTTLGTKGEKGTGLGLILCKELVDLNKGIFEVESEKGIGSTFIVKIPKYIDN